MRYLKDIAHSQLKISLYAWNSKYIIKIEAGPYEQTYKVAEFDLTGPDDVEELLTETFLATVAARFQEMDADWTASLNNLD
ncbi:hypothetical protein [Fibrivirga algicola]|uniref:Uncharacterized protein n=1 Tax=Fibrivirga algicola TaxID=2950420 RepID=A0ABX0QJ29_9BACT|nr:hypothetical protein [Fibrivirga algicola]ARK12421.1 hypothetical protein A6C57_19925 [Fibrella sp. ES10-3-2-2]NID12444.1 hypothetical protein [Fibrivirga algicola]